MVDAIVVWTAFCLSAAAVGGCGGGGGVARWPAEREVPLEEVVVDWDGGVVRGGGVGELGGFAHCVVLAVLVLRVLGREEVGLQIRFLVGDFALNCALVAICATV